MAIEANFKGFLRWKDGVKQHVTPAKGETRQDAIRFMRDHLNYFELADELTFHEGEIFKKGRDFVFTLRAKSKMGHNIIRPGLAPELEAASKK